MNQKIKLGLAGVVALVLLGMATLFFSSDQKDVQQEEGMKFSEENKNKSEKQANEQTAAETGQGEKLSIKLSPDKEKNYALIMSHFLRLEKGAFKPAVFFSGDGREMSPEESSKEVFSLDVAKRPEIFNMAQIKIYVLRGEYGPSEAIIFKNGKTRLENQAEMKAWEATMFDDLKRFALFGEKFDTVAVSKDKTFYDSGYRSDWRYVNFTQDKKITLDYLFGDGYVVIANSLEVCQKILAQKVYL